MRHLTAILCLTLAVLLGSAGVSESADFQKCVDAYNKKDYATALREWKPLAEQGLADAQSNLGLMYDEGKGVPQNDKTAVKWYRLAAKQGDADAQEQVEKLQKKIAQLENEKKPKPAKQVAKKSPTPSSADFQKGLDAAQKGDFATALREWKPLAEQGVAFAQYNLGVMYANGQGVPQNYKTAVKWYRLAAKQGLAGAQYYLGVM